MNIPTIHTTRRGIHVDNNKASLFMQRLEHVDAHYDGVAGQKPVVAIAAERHRRIYLAGPMTGLPEYNYPAFNAEAARLRALGYHVENPAENPEQSSWEDYLRQAIRQMLTCDMVALLPGWEGSRGAGFERSVALQVGMALVLADQVTGTPAAPTVKAEQAEPAIDYKRKFECLVDHAKRQDKVISDMRYDENIRRFYDDGAVWFWAGDGTDNLETLACPVVINAGDLRALLAPSLPAAGSAGKYDSVLRPFFAMMEAELHANSGKGDRPGWLAMSAEQCMLEIYYHAAKLQKAVKKNDMQGVREYSADVANMSMMMADIVGWLDIVNAELSTKGDDQ